MKTGVLLTLLLSCAGAALPSEIVVLTDGNRMEVDTYEVRGNVIVITTLEGRLRSLPVTYVDLEATARANAGAAAAPISGTSETTQPAPLSTAPPASTDSIENARRALELYGERELFVAMHAQARSALTSLEGRAPKDFYDLLMDAIRRGFDPDALMERSASRLAADADRALLTDWLRWLETSSIRAIAEAEKAADRPEAEAERKEFVAELAQSPPTASRERLVARLSEALSLAESARTR